jgi:hypothetical protein
MRRNCGGRFGFGGSAVLPVSSGDPVSFYTTVGGVVIEGRADFLYLPLSTLR